MSKLESLSLALLKDGKIQAETIIKKLANAIDEGIDVADEYRELYEMAYGTSITKELAESWVKSMSVVDNEQADGQKWTVDQCYEVGNKIGMDWNKHSRWCWYVVMNMMYSDYFKTARYVEKIGDPVFFAHLAKDWLEDDDVIENKLYNYYFSLVL